MSVISGHVAKKEGYVIGASEDNIQPASIDVRLGGELMSFNDSMFPPIIDPAEPLPDKAMQREHIGTGVPLEPGKLVLGSTVEFIELPLDVSAVFAGKSSLARIGLSVHVTAGWIDPGFRGQITVEMTNVNQFPILLRSGMRIGQIVFYRMETPAGVAYGQANNSYQGQSGPTPYRGYRSYTAGEQSHGVWELGSRLVKPIRKAFHEGNK